MKGSPPPASRLDKGDVTALSLPAAAGHGDADGPICLDVPDGTPDPHRTKAAIEHLHQKILKITEQIKIEQEARDDNVAEYLKLANNADKQQASRIKQVFEKKNQKSAQTIAQLHKKLEHYHKKLKEIEQNGPSRQPKDVFRDMHQGLKDVGANVRSSISGFGGGVVEGVKGGLSGLSQATHTAVVSKPREFASLIRNKFGSADNIAHLKDTLDLGLGRRQQLRGRARGFGEPQVQHAGQPPQQLRHHPGGAPGDQGQPVTPGGLHGGPQGAAAAGLHLHDAVPAGGAVQVRAPGGAAERPHRAAPERNDQPEAGAGEHGGEGGLPVLREGAGHPGSGGVLPDAGDQAGAAAAAAAGGAAGRGGERQRPGAAGQVHQRHPGPDGRAARLRLHHRQLHHPAHEDPHAHPQHRPARPLPLLPLEALGLHHLLSGARPAPQLIRGPAAAAWGLSVSHGGGDGMGGGDAAVWSLRVVSSHAVRSLCRPLLRLAAVARSVAESVPRDAQGGRNGERGGVWEETGRLCGGGFF
uniref:Transmembrane and coiled-coil domain family 2 n=1 Tax=Anser cygnoides TaxID=8845 RepID=A0A8B9D7E4_ANSCY